MDSRIKRNAIIFCIMSILCIASIVVMANWRQLLGDGVNSPAIHIQEDADNVQNENGQMGFPCAILIMLGGFWPPAFFM